jgi:phage-related protein
VLKNAQKWQKTRFGEHVAILGLQIPLLCTIFGTQMSRLPKTERSIKKVPAIFFRTEAGSEPVREWLKELSKEDKRAIGADIQTVEFGWPIGMPFARAMGDGLHEVRTTLLGNRIARVLFYVDRRGRMVLLHAFIKKTRKTSEEDLELARKNKAKHEKGLR